MRTRLTLALTLLLSTATSAQDNLTTKPARSADEAVNSAGVRQRQGLTPSDTILFNGWGVTPAGTHTPISDMALKMIVSPDGTRLLAACGGYNNQGLAVLDVATAKVTQFFPMPEAWNGIAFSSDGKRVFVVGGDKGTIHVFTYADGTLKEDRVVKPEAGGPVFLAGLAVHPDTGRVYVCNEANHEIWVLDGENLQIQHKVAVGQHPHTCVIGADRRHLYVSNWGSRSVSAVDMESNRRVRELTVGIRPNDMALAPDGRLFVSCGGDNSVHVIPTKSLEKAPEPANANRRLWEGAREIISTSLYPQSPEGSTPDAVTVSPDGKTLFVANADNNNVMVVDISGAILDDKTRKFNESVSIVNGFIPTGWYPSALAVSPDNKTLFVANGKGLRSHPNAQLNDPKGDEKPGKRPLKHIGKTLEGSISAIPKPDAAQMAAYTQQTRRNSPYTPEAFHRAPLPANSVIPDRVGAPCPIKYVLYVIKENRTYDQVLGDMTDAAGKPIGNGEPRLTLYGEQITPNQHQLARDYVLFDNLYCNGEVSVDGHSWCDAAIATDFNTRSWTMAYGKHGKVPGNEEMETPANGYLWDLCRRHGVTFRNYGEGGQRVPSANRGHWPAPWTARDMDKISFWIEDLKAAEQPGNELPRFTIMSLGEDHTQGATPGANTPNACVASNDLAVGRIVEAASHSKFWPEMAIFIIEDDAQNGPDHVDAHRTTGYVISPYVKRHHVDSTLYTTASMIRTMELILGLPPLTQYDAGATPMFNAFQNEPVLTPYTPIVPKVDLAAVNAPDAPFGKQSSRMNWKDYDRAPEDELNRILWHIAKPGEPYPTPIHRALFTTPTVPLGSEREREGAK